MAEEKKPTDIIEEVTQDIINPIDPDKITDKPHLLTYPHERGGVEIKPVDKGKIKGRAVSAMHEQTNIQLDQIKEQIDLLARQAKDIQDRVTISEEIYTAEMNFEPLIGRNYHLYRRDGGKKPVLSLVSPAEWGPNPPYEFVATIRMLADHTWEVLAKNETAL